MKDDKIPLILVVLVVAVWTWMIGALIFGLLSEATMLNG